MTRFTDFFKAVTGHDPYSYRRRLAREDQLPKLRNIPTGASKTAAVVGGFDGGGQASMPLTPGSWFGMRPKVSRARAAWAVG